MKNKVLIVYASCVGSAGEVAKVIGQTLSDAGAFAVQCLSSGAVAEGSELKAENSESFFCL